MAHWHDALTRRLRSLLKTGPLHALRTHAGRRESVLPHDDPLALAMRALEVLADALGLRPGATREEVHAALLPLLHSGDEEAGVTPDPERHRDVVNAVIGALLNEGERRQAYREWYTDYAGPRPERRVMDFRLASEREANDGIVLRVESDGINLFLRSLDVDLEDAQAAAEAILRSQMERGHLEHAAATAREAQVRSIQYTDQVRDILARTRRDVARVDWREEVPALVEEAAKHLGARLRVERELLESVDEQLNIVTHEERAGALARIRAALDDCLTRHAQLHLQLMGAFDVFRAEQARQRFAPVPRVTLPPLGDGLLLPMARMTMAHAMDVADAFVHHVHPAAALPVLDLGILWNHLLAPPRERLLPGRPAASQLEQVLPPPPRFDAAACERVDALLRGLQEPARLSSLLSMTTDPVDAEFLVLRTLQHFAPDASPPLPIRAEKTAAPLVTPTHAGDDVLITPGGSGG